MAPMKPKVPEYPRPVPSICTDEIPICPGTIVYQVRKPVMKQEDEQEPRAPKRRRIEAHAISYLRGVPIFISSAQLRGPFEKNWNNPFIQRRKQEVKDNQVLQSETTESRSKRKLHDHLKPGKRNDTSKSASIEEKISSINSINQERSDDNLKNVNTEAVVQSIDDRQQLLPNKSKNALEKNVHKDVPKLEWLRSNEDHPATTGTVDRSLLTPTPIRTNDEQVPLVEDKEEEKFETARPLPVQLTDSQTSFSATPRRGKRKSTPTPTPPCKTETEAHPAGISARRPRNVQSNYEDPDWVVDSHPTKISAKAAGKFGHPGTDRVISTQTSKISSSVDLPSAQIQPLPPAPVPLAHVGHSQAMLEEGGKVEDRQNEQTVICHNTGSTEPGITKSNTLLNRDGSGSIKADRFAPYRKSKVQNNPENDMPTKPSEMSQVSIDSYLPPLEKKDQSSKSAGRLSVTFETFSSPPSQGSIKSSMRVSKAVLPEGKHAGYKDLKEDDRIRDSFPILPGEHGESQSGVVAQESSGNSKRKGILKSIRTNKSGTASSPAFGTVSTSTKQDAQIIEMENIASSVSMDEDGNFDLDAAITDLGSFLGTWDAEKEASKLVMTS